MRRCYVCKLTKPLEEFTRDKSKTEGRSYRCKVCDHAAAVRYQREGPAGPLKPHRTFTDIEDVGQRELVRRRTSRHVREADLQREMYSVYGELCSCCGDTKALTIDHIVKSPEDGPSGRAPYVLMMQMQREGWPKDKYQILCKSCNSSKGDGPKCRLHP